MQQLYLCTFGCIYLVLLYIHNTRTARCSSYTCVPLDVYICYLLYSQHLDCTMQQLYLCTRMYILGICYIRNIRTARCSSYTCVPLDVYIWYLLYSQHLDCTMQQLYLCTRMYIIGICYIRNIQTARCSSYICVLLDLYIWYLLYIHNTRTARNTQTARCSSYICVPLSVYIRYLLYSQHLDCMMQRLFLCSIGCIYLVLVIFATFQIARCSCYSCVALDVNICCCIYLVFVIYLQHYSDNTMQRLYKCTIGCIYLVLVIYSQHSNCTMQQLYTATCYILTTVKRHNAEVILVDHWTYIFATCFMYSQHSDCMTQLSYLCTS